MLGLLQLVGFPFVSQVGTPDGFEAYHPASDPTAIDLRSAFLHAVRQHAIRRTAADRVAGEPVLIKLGFDHRAETVDADDRQLLAYEV